MVSNWLYHWIISLKFCRWPVTTHCFPRECLRWNDTQLRMKWVTFENVVCTPRFFALLSPFLSTVPAQWRSSIVSARRWMCICRFSGGSVGMERMYVHGTVCMNNTERDGFYRNWPIWSGRRAVKTGDEFFKQMKVIGILIVTLTFPHFRNQFPKIITKLFKHCHVIRYLEVILQRLENLELELLLPYLVPNSSCDTNFRPQTLYFYARLPKIWCVTSFCNKTLYNQKDIRSR